MRQRDACTLWICDFVQFVYLYDLLHPLRKSIAIHNNNWLQFAVSFLIILYMFDILYGLTFQRPMTWCDQFEQFYFFFSFLSFYR